MPRLLLPLSLVLIFLPFSPIIIFATIGSAAFARVVEIVSQTTLPSVAHPVSASPIHDGDASSLARPQSLALRGTNY